MKSALKKFRGERLKFSVYKGTEFRTKRKCFYLECGVGECVKMFVLLLDIAFMDMVNVVATCVSALKHDILRITYLPFI